MDEYVKLFQHYSPLITPAISVVTFIAGMFVGDWLATRRDRRKEYNAATDGVRLKLRSQLKSIDNEYLDSRFHITEAERSRLVDVFLPCRKDKIEKALCRYDDAYKNCGDHDRSGKFIFTNKSIIYEEIKNLIALIKHR
ncbi:hypothetical protein [Pectobacterium carotovorum]|uniref:hypothetical protein n=1 Tax=Pectobacterium carotovorum TaxID=554 RepID=UPI0021F3172B|nr:hypothetical protein [Pectobacterium carotovorum]